MYNRINGTPVNIPLEYVKKVIFVLLDIRIDQLLRHPFPGEKKYSTVFSTFLKFKYSTVVVIEFHLSSKE